MKLIILKARDQYVSPYKCVCLFLLSPVFLIYRKSTKISPGAYIFERPFLRGLFLEGLVFGGAYLRREICVSKSIGLALQLEGNLPFLLCFILYLRAISKYKPLGGLYLEGRFNGGFFCVISLLGLYLEGRIRGGAYFRNFTVLCIYYVYLSPFKRGRVTDLILILRTSRRNRRKTSIL